MREAGIALTCGEAQEICRRLKAEGIDVSPFDLPNTRGMWAGIDARTGQTYVRLATKELLRPLHYGFRTPEGFRELLPKLTVETFRTHPINQWGTKLYGLLSKLSSSPARAICDLVENDPEMAAIADIGFQAFDLPKAPHGSWVDQDNNPTKLCVVATTPLLDTVAREVKTALWTLGGFQHILDEFSLDDFE
jgi:hypothetical protein